MTKLHDLHRRLSQLRRRRRRVRLEIGGSALALALLWILGTALLVDWTLEMSLAQRLICWIVGAGVAAWAFAKFTLPWLGHHETELDMAILVERTEHIDCDLVAAVQFELPEAPEWGSVQLEQAVIDQVAATGSRLNVMRGIPRKQLSRRFALLAVTVVAWAGTTWVAPGHVAAFFRRLAFDSIHYPTDTTIESIVVKSCPADPLQTTDWSDVEGRSVDPVRPGREPLKILYGNRIRFEVQCSGTLPDEGKAALRVTRNELRKTCRLQRVGDTNVYAGELDRLREEIQYQLYLGDAWTDPAILTVTQLPRAQVELEVLSPPYITAATGNASRRQPPGLRQVSVIEGSRVLIKLRSTKPLDRATVTLKRRRLESDEIAICPMRPDNSDAEAAPGTRWILDAESSDAESSDAESSDAGAQTPAATWLSPVLGRVEFLVDVTDTDDQGLEKPIAGMVRIRPDLPPRLAAAIVTPFVLPDAIPSVTFRATDDYGVAGVSLLCEVIHEDGLPDPQREIAIYPAPRPVGEAGQDGSPGDRLPLRDTGPSRRFTLDLTAMDLKKGDRIKVTPKAVDFRGDPSRGGRPGKSALGDSFVFQVTDQQGILREMIIEQDQHSAVQLDAMIQRQLGIGDSP
ncbi:MAG: hypothetical protein V3R99_10995 [Thermoguttaceae bacterium]